MKRTNLFLNVFIIKSLYFCLIGSLETKKYQNTKSLTRLKINKNNEIQKRRKNLIGIDMSSPSMTINVISSNNEAVPTPNKSNVIIIPAPSGSSSSNSNGVILPPSLVLPPNMDASNFGILDSNNGNDAETYTSTESPTLPPTTKSTPLPPPTSAPIAAMTSVPTKTPTESPKTSDPTKLPTKEPTFSPTISPITKPPKKDTNKPNFSTKNSSYPKYWFDYNPSSDYGPYEWDKVDLGNENLYLNYIMDDTNECDKDNEQSPINIRADNQCKDDHTPAQERGKTKFNELKFEIESSGLRAILGDGNTPPKGWT